MKALLSVFCMPTQPEAVREINPSPKDRIRLEIREEIAGNPRFPSGRSDQSTVGNGTGAGATCPIVEQIWRGRAVCVSKRAFPQQDPTARACTALP